MKCKRCGRESGSARVCHSCIKQWKERREAAFNQAIEELGPPNKDNLKAIQKRVKKLERKWEEKP